MTYDLHIIVYMELHDAKTRCSCINLKLSTMHLEILFYNWAGLQNLVALFQTLEAICLTYDSCIGGPKLNKKK